MKGPPIVLNVEMAAEIMNRFRETAVFRNWLLYAAAIMRTHFHLVVGVPDDPDPSEVLADFKSYASRGLNRKWPRPVSNTWWTSSGSKRKLPDHIAVVSAVRYVRDQFSPLQIWINPEAELDF